jgi:aminopeptidase N
MTDLPDAFTLQTVVRIDPDKNTRLSGLYRSKDGYFTQCEAQGFRRITWFLDRPDVMSTYTVTLHADKEALPILLANGNPVAQGDEPNGRHWARWADPFRKPCYLFALVAGKLDCLFDTSKPPPAAASSSPSTSNRASSTNARTPWQRCKNRCAGTKGASASNATSTIT